MTPRTPADRISAKAILVGRVAAGIAHDCADLTDREAASGWGRSRPCVHDQPDGHGADTMRSVLALCLLITLCASTDAANVASLQTARAPLTARPACHCHQALRCSRLDRRTNSVLALEQQLGLIVAVPPAGTPAGPKESLGSVNQRP
jgi:hypothetical protein